MKIIKRGTLSNGIEAVIEDWSENYSSLIKKYTVAIFPKSKTSLSGPFEPKENKTFRIECDFATLDEAIGNLKELCKGHISLVEFVDKFYSGNIEKNKIMSCI